VKVSVELPVLALIPARRSVLAALSTAWPREAAFK
jgi:hypothetical protein